MKSLLGALAISAALSTSATFAQDMPPAPSPPPPPPMGADLASIPTVEAIHAREARDGARIQNAEQAGDMSPSEAHRVREELTNIRTQEAELASRDGADLTATDRQFINDRLDQLGRSIRWIRSRETDRW